MIAAEPGHTGQGLSWEVVQRLHSLKGIETWLSDREDDVKLLSTIKEIKDAYRSGKLGWNHGLVTYWSHGQQISQPRPFNWDEFTRINKMHDGNEGFWVEGVSKFSHTSRRALQSILDTLVNVLFSLQLHGYKDSQIGAIQQIRTTAHGPTSYVQNVSDTHYHSNPAITNPVILVECFVSINGSADLSRRSCA